MNQRSPLVGTGEEHVIMRDTGHNVIAHNDETVINVNSIRIFVYEPRYQKQRVYPLPQSDKSNQIDVSKNTSSY